MFISNGSMCKFMLSGLLLVSYAALFFFFLMLFVGQSFADFACKETYKEGVLNLWNLKLMLLCKSALPRYSYLGST